MPQRTVTPDSNAAADVFVDPVCGMTVQPADAAGTLEYKGHTYFFCSKNCLERFKLRPEEFLQSETRPAADSPGVEYVCPMHPEVRQAGPGPCPKCGMALEPATLSAPVNRVEYTCPMHPEIIRDQPGSCPICGMTLEPREVFGARQK